MMIDKMMILGMFEVALSFMSFYVIYKNSDRMANLIYFFTGLSCSVYALSYFSGHQEYLHRTLRLEHFFIQIAILVKFMSIRWATL